MQYFLNQNLKEINVTKLFANSISWKWDMANLRLHDS